MNRKVQHADLQPPTSPSVEGEVGGVHEVLGAEEPVWIGTVGDDEQLDSRQSSPLSASMRRSCSSTALAIS